MLALTWAVLSALTLSVSAGTKVWDGSFNSYANASDFEKWSFANEVGTYQWYIHGSQSTSHYLDVSSSYKNPAMTSEQRGIKMTIDGTSNWNGQTMERTELIPQTSSNIGTGNLFYHFSVKHTSTNPPDSTLEHQVCFFESHFTELKYGVGSNPTSLSWMISGVEQWSTPFTADTWFNFAYDINFSSQTVGLWASTGSSPLTKVVQNKSAPTSTNSADWHLGVLRLITNQTPEDWYFSGVYVESGSITTAIGSGGNSTSPTSSPPSSTTPPTITTPPMTTTPTSAWPGQTHYGQCGGQGWAGPTVCASPYTCTPVSPPYYYCCL